MGTRSALKAAFAAALVAVSTVPGAALAAIEPCDQVRMAVDPVIKSVMDQFTIPGMAVGVIVDESACVFDYGMSSKKTRKPINGKTLFEIGSISKVATATLSAYAVASGRLSLSDHTSRYLPALRGTQFGDVALLNLGTYTPGGFPLQVPDEIKNDAQLMKYLTAWKPDYPAGTYRTYTNVSIGLLGVITAKALGGDFATLMERDLFTAFGMSDTYIDVPNKARADYAQGYTTKGVPIRMAPGELGAETYGVRTTAADLTRFLQVQMHLLKIGGLWDEAVTQTQVAYFQAGPMIQDLVWEQYPFPAPLATILEGNDLDPMAVTAFQPPLKAQQDVWINKTGSTNGFAAYVAFVPRTKRGIVILANKNFPIADRVTAAYQIIAALSPR